MQSFRSLHSSTPLSTASIPDIIVDVVRPGHFFVTEGELQFTQATEVESRWEIFRGRLLDPAHTREQATFDEWNVHHVANGERSGEPIVSVKLDVARRELHVVRGLYCYVWEGHDSGAGVIDSREAEKWTRELAGTIRINTIADEESLRDELICLVFQAFVGLSRLPLTSVEAPHPLYSFGGMTYCYRTKSNDASMRTYREFMAATKHDNLSPREEVKRLETLLHLTPSENLSELAAEYREKLIPLLRRLYNEVSLSPWTDLVDKTLSLLEATERDGIETPERIVDFLSYLLRQNGRHLTAYDLITFHHRGANYPDALLLDTVLKRYVQYAESFSELFHGDDTSPRLRRRALRQAFLLRRSYEGHLVPDAPTSPGENARVLPDSHPRVPEEQILNPIKRKRRLYDNDPLTIYLTDAARAVLDRSLHDLTDERELRELGTALFLDRPLGIAKAMGEPDQTVLLSHLAFSPTIARRRLHLLHEKLNVHSADALHQCSEQLDQMKLAGVSLAQIGGRQRPGTVSALDARLVADDFLYLRTTTSSARELFEQYDVNLTRHGIDVNEPMLILPVNDSGLLRIYDASARPRLDLRPRFEDGYLSRAGREIVAGGLEALDSGNAK